MKLARNAHGHEWENPFFGSRALGLIDASTGSWQHG